MLANSCRGKSNLCNDKHDYFFVHKNGCYWSSNIKIHSEIFSSFFLQSWSQIRLKATIPRWFFCSIGIFLFLTFNSPSSYLSLAVISRYYNVCANCASSDLRIKVSLLEWSSVCTLSVWLDKNIPSTHPLHCPIELSFGLHKRINNYFNA
jgi:hypothetical protein